jgi:hypothetical protein
MQKTDHVGWRPAWKLATRAVRKFVKQPGDAWLLCRMAWWVVVLSVAARFCSLPRALALVAGGERTTKCPDVTDVPERLARSIDVLLAADVFVFRPICWKRAAVLHRYLSRKGITTRIIFGVRNEPAGQVAGHAWLESEGAPILESTPPEYVVTYRFPSNEHFDPQLATLSTD